MTKEAFGKLLKQNEIYLKSSETKTSDSQVLEIYAYIIQHENKDSDWWIEDHGTNDIISIIQKSDEDIFNRIQEDIFNWNSEQIELFARTLLSNDYKDYKVNERIRLYLELLDIQRTDYDLYDTFYSANIDLKLAEKELLIRLAEKLKFRSVEELLNSI
jgi:hypothetical protein